MQPSSQELYDRPVVAVARDLLNKVIVVGGPSGRIVEVEAYGGEEDAGSHAWRGRTARTELMYGPPGHSYLYLIYGVHWCANVVVDSDGRASAVLFRAVVPLTGVEEIQAARGSVADRHLANGPGKLMKVLGMGSELNGTLVAASTAKIVDDGIPAPRGPVVSKRIGLSRNRAPDTPWRFLVP